MATIKNYTTTVDASRSISEIQGFLARSGATKIMFDYDEKGSVKAIMFMLKISDREMPFKLPAKPDAVYKVLYEGKPIRQWSRRNEIEDNRKKQCLNTSWRIIKDWIEAQFTLIELEQAEAAEIFMPYLMVSQEKTLYESNKDSGFISLLPKN